MSAAGARAGCIAVPALACLELSRCPAGPRVRTATHTWLASMTCGPPAGLGRPVPSGPPAAAAASVPLVRITLRTPCRFSSRIAKPGLKHQKQYRRAGFVGAPWFAGARFARLCAASSTPTWHRYKRETSSRLSFNSAEKTAPRKASMRAKPGLPALAACPPSPPPAAFTLNADALAAAGSRSFCTAATTPRTSGAVSKVKLSVPSRSYTWWPGNVVPSGGMARPSRVSSSFSKRACAPSKRGMPSIAACCGTASSRQRGPSGAQCGSHPPSRLHRRPQSILARRRASGSAALPLAPDARTSSASARRRPSQCPS